MEGKRVNTGYLFAFGAAVALSASFIFSKSALNYVSMIQFGAVWFSLGVVWNSIWYFGRGLHKNFKDGTKKRVQVAILIAVLEGIATGLFYMAIKAMENPAVVSFIGNIGPVFVTVLAFILLRERFKGVQLAGIIITISGVFVMNFRDGAFHGFLDPGAIYVICASLIFALATIAGRYYKQDLDPHLMSMIRVFLLAAVFIVLLLSSGESIELPPQVWRDLAIGSLFETLITIVLAYQALKRIKATSTSLIISSKAVWTLVFAWLFLNVFPTELQLVGGVLTMIGVWLVTWRRS